MPLGARCLRAGIFELLPVRVTDQSGLLCSLAGEPTGALVRTIHGDQISKLTHVLDPRLPLLINQSTRTSSTPSTPS